MKVDVSQPDVRPFEAQEAEHGFPATPRVVNVVFRIDVLPDGFETHLGGAEGKVAVTLDEGFWNLPLQDICAEAQRRLPEHLRRIAAAIEAG